MHLSKSHVQRTRIDLAPQHRAGHVLRVPVVHGGRLLVFVGEEHAQSDGRLDDQVRLGEQHQAPLLSYLWTHKHA